MHKGEQLLSLTRVNEFSRRVKARCPFVMTHVNDKRERLLSTTKVHNTLAKLLSNSCQRLLSTHVQRQLSTSVACFCRSLSTSSQGPVKEPRPVLTESCQRQASTTLVNDKRQHDMPWHRTFLIQWKRQSETKVKRTPHEERHDEAVLHARMLDRSGKRAVQDTSPSAAPATRSTKHSTDAQRAEPATQAA